MTNISIQTTEIKTESGNSQSKNNNNQVNSNRKIFLSFIELKNKIKGVILGLFDSIAASFGTALGISILTSDRWTILSLARLSVSPIQMNLRYFMH